MRRFLVLLTAAALAWPAAAPAKEWMTVSGHGGGVTAGERWTATLKLPTHPDAGPLPRQHPELVFTHLDTYAQRRFAAKPTGRRGFYRASVVLATPGTWTIYVYAREIGAASPDPRSNEVVVRPAADSGPPVAALALGAGALGAIGLLVLSRLRRRA